MMIEHVLFYLFSGLVLLAISYMIYTPKLIHGVYAFASILLSLAGIFVLLNAEFLAVVQLFMYAGGVVVLFIFGVMLTNRVKNESPVSGHRAVFASVLVVGSLLAFMLTILWQANLTWNPTAIEFDQTRKIGMLFLTDHLLAFELIAVLLLSVLVGAAFLAKKTSDHE
jgi:NADH-quinone oxidoreductase subunit J